MTGVNITLETYVLILSKYHRAPVAPEQAEDYFSRLLFNLLDTIAQTSLSAAGKSTYGEKITPLDVEILLIDNGSDRGRPVGAIEAAVAAAPIETADREFSEPPFHRDRPGGLRHEPLRGRG